MYIMAFLVLQVPLSDKESMFNPEQYSQAQSLIEAHIRSFDTCAKAVLQSSAGLVDLQLDAVKNALATATDSSHHMLSLKDPQDWMNLTAVQSQQAFDRAQAYGRQAAGIAREAHALLTQAAAPLQGFFNSTNETSPK
jgi:phasin family protein